jgi:alginate O-acetyltransferase complex protein AlgI
MPSYISFQVAHLLVIVGSGFFYGYWNPAYVILPFFLTIIGWRGALWIQASNGKQRYGRLIGTVVLLLVPLLFFKYTNFLINDFLLPLVLFHAPSESIKYVDLALPLGISFITFTLISYVVDVYKGLSPSEKGVKWLFGYILFFPQLIAGPILRPSQLLPQLKRSRLWNRRLWIAGLTIFSIGLVKNWCSPIRLHE